MTVTAAFLMSYVFAWGLLLVNFVVLVLILRVHGMVLLHDRDTQGPPVGVKPRQLVGELVFEDHRRPRLPTLSLFVAPDCPPCRAVLRKVAGVAPSLSRRANIVVSSEGSVAATRRFAAILSSAPVTILADPSARNSIGWRIVKTPYMISTDRDGKVVHRLDRVTKDIIVEALRELDMVGAVVAHAGRGSQHVPRV